MPVATTGNALAAGQGISIVVRKQTRRVIVVNDPTPPLAPSGKQWPR